jgi:hypothetical protein
VFDRLEGPYHQIRALRTYQRTNEIEHLVIARQIMAQDKVGPGAG